MSGRAERPLIAIVLAGGTGTRLWPLSRSDMPKQFLPLVGPESLYQQTLLRARAVSGPSAERPIVVTNAVNRDIVIEQARAAGVDLGAVVLEQVGRSTAPAITLAALLACRTMNRTDPLLLVLPADHIVGDAAAFAAAVRVAVTAAEHGRLVTFGVVPDRPETGYGYIERGESRGDWAEVRRFVEKPDLPTAESYVRAGSYLWNSGMFLFPAARLLEEVGTHAPAVLAACERAFAELSPTSSVLELGATFSAAPSISIDNAVMERTANAAVVPLVAGWSDVGSWSALHDAVAHDEQGNSVQGDVLLESCRNTFVAARHRVVATVGLDDVIVVETDDAVLVVHRDHAQDVKVIVERLRRRNAGK